MIPCVWAFIKRRRTKDYNQVLEALIKVASARNLILRQDFVMIGFELTVQKLFQKNRFTIGLLLLKDYFKNIVELYN